MDGYIEITGDVSIRESDLEFQFSRSGGPGGQNVNKVSTRVTLRFNLDASEDLDAAQKERIREKLSTRISKDGVLRVAAQRHRSQAANREETIARFILLLQDALEENPERKKTRVPPSVRRERVRRKRIHGRIKRERSQQFDPEDM